LRYEETCRELIEITENYEKKVREISTYEETITKVKIERDELYHKIEHLQREVKAKACGWEEAEDRCGKWKLKYEHYEREIKSLHEKIKITESERTELHESIAKVREEYRLIVIERDQLKEDYHHECKKAADSHRKIIVLQESLRRTDSTLKEVREEVHRMTERITRIETERDGALQRCGDLSIEVTELKQTITVLNTEIGTSLRFRSACLPQTLLTMFLLFSHPHRNAQRHSRRNPQLEAQIRAGFRNCH
jgi:chromosome segregation ATPase